MMKITVVGSGYVGTVAAACFADLGHRVRALEANPEKLAALEAGRVPFHEPGLDELVRLGLDSGNLSFTADPAEAVEGTEIIFLCVGTPPRPDGRTDMSAMESAARSVGAALEHSSVIVTKSTVPIGTGAWLAEVMREELDAAGRTDVMVSVASNPEFLREGNAIKDFFCPDRVVIGSADDGALDVLTRAYQPILDHLDRCTTPQPALVRTDLLTAETIKYAANTFLATKISFINEIARVCDAVGADVTDVAQAIGLDPRIGPQFLNAGIGWGGSCFGKDITSLSTTATDHGIDMHILDAVLAVNGAQRRLVRDRLIGELGLLQGKQITLLGLAFKPRTDDLRDAPALDIITSLTDAGAVVHAHDPAVKDVPGYAVQTFADPYLASEGSDAVVLVTEWAEFKTLDLAELHRRMRGQVFMDGRNVLAPEDLIAAGFRYVGIGRGRISNS